MTGTILNREECRVILDMDAVFRSAWQEEADASAERAREKAGKKR